MQQSSNNGQDKQTNILYIPIVRLEVDSNHPRFKAGEPIQFRVKARCNNVTIPKDGLEYQWVYTDSLGFKKSFTSKEDTIMVTCPNSFCGRSITIEVTINLFATQSEENGQSNSPLKSVSSIDKLEDKICIYPECEKKRLTDAEWFLGDAALPNGIHALVELSGYNGSTVILSQVITEQETVVWECTGKIIVKNNQIVISFSRTNCPINIGENKTYTFRFGLFDTKDGTQIGDFSQNLMIEGLKSIPEIDRSALQPVVVGVVDIIENNYMPCKYTQIDVEYTKESDSEEKEKVTVFEEGIPIKQKLNIVGGRRKVTVKLSDYTPEKCNRKTESHKDKKAILKLQGQSTPPIQIEDNQVEFEVKYNYGESLENSRIIEAWNRKDPLAFAKEIAKDIVDVKEFKEVLKYLWLPKDLIQNNSLQVSTCRYSHVVELNMVPDIKWSVSLEVTNDSPLHYSHKNMPAKYDIFKRHQDKAREAGFLQKFNIDDIKVSFSLSAELADGMELKVGVAYIESIKKVVGLLGSIKQLIDALSFKKLATDKGVSVAKLLPKKSKLPCFLEISSPTLVLGGSWQYTTDSYHLPTSKGEVIIAANPLIEAKGGIDLIACITFIPVVGQIVKAILAINDAAEWVTKKLSNGKADYDGEIWFNLYLKGCLSMEGSISFSEEEKDTTLTTPIKLIFGVELGLKAEVTTKTVTITGETTTVVKASAEGKAETSIQFEPSLGYNSENGLYLKTKVKFGGLMLTVSGQAIYEKTNNGEKKSWGLAPTEETFALIKETTPWKENIPLFQ